MTEGGWLVCVSPPTMLRFLRESHRASDRKCLLLAVACARRHWDALSEQERHAYEITERYVEGRATWDELSEAALPRHGEARKPATRLRQFVDDTLVNASVRSTRDAFGRLRDAMGAGHGFDELRQLAAALGLSDGAARDPRDGWVEADQRESLAQELTIRDLVGNPFRPVALDRAWLTPQVVALARAIYEERAFDRLPALADALEAAGCRDTEILGHCRSDGPHARGCWVVDILLASV